MPLRGKRLLVTSGPTRVALDAVRYITNKATGRLGALIAEEVVRRGAHVTYVYGRGSQTPVLRGPRVDHLQLVPVETVDDLIAVFRQELPGGGYHAVIHPMAVLDFQPDTVRPYKTGSHVQEWVVRLVPTPKAIALVKELAPDTFLVGFKLEIGKTPEELRQIAHDFLRRNRCDLVIANDLSEIESGRHIGYFITPDGRIAQMPIGKEAIARALADYLDEHLV
ncbi:MAG: phosphopantothenoylcysteine decarboxylase [Armatimonadota bacterium]|nr:phosphopantothenoylcysteine decarboxylase [Armatimonadota bacterium]MDR7402912.1 phosphopantothenoylcysteine decarboxylase [Armatimonadota bacterium]MDR7438185.1 phosphopantothenoylcysteine decarboxylase [Armatimonadota bacterium]MDR7473249.1 phosphopantothenoylcysteine decarboxylase [Armatimonadota bacterium]MDR7508032.1 phosphopantothenoylcysteine decarboxylase [Armatimonadota bacterium]